MNRSSEDIPDAEKVRSLLKDIREVRQAKTREGVKKIDNSELTVCSLGLDRFHLRELPLLGSELMFNGDKRDMTLLYACHGYINTSSPQSNG